MADFQPRNVLVTGGAGFIGANFIHYLLSVDKTVKVINLDLLTYAASLTHLQDLPDPSRHTFVQGDIGDGALVQQLFQAHAIDTVVHFAAESHVDNSILRPAAFIQTNIVGTFTLLEAARSYWGDSNKAAYRFHHISTDEVYGSLTKEASAFTEATRYQPNSPYSASKASSDHLVRAYAHTYGLPITVSNCSNNYGPFQHPEKFIPTVIRACLNQQPIPVYGDGSNIRDWLYVKDHCCAIEQILRRGEVGETYNIGGWNEWSNLSVVEYICQLLDRARPANAPHHRLIQFVTDRPGHDWRYAVDATKIKQGLGWIPQESFQSGMAKTVAFYLREQ